jgi:3',5'-nucleoside bisphosphate phosphatase
VTARLSYFSADLHVHTVLSPCAEIEMIPPLIMQQAVRLGLSIVAVTDHNAAENAAAMVEAGAREGITVLPGMEVQTREEVHLICLFDTVEQDLTWQDQVYRHLPPLKNREEVFGSQLIVDADGEFVAFQDRLLLTSTTFSVEDVFREVGNLRGIVIPAHVDRPAFSLIANLGFFPEGISAPAAEVSVRTTTQEARDRFPQLRGLTLIQDGDAHRLSEMQNRSMFKIAHPSVAELRMACLQLEGRKVVID